MTDVDRLAKVICRADFPEDWERWWEDDEELQQSYITRAEAALEDLRIRISMESGEILMTRWAEATRAAGQPMILYPHPGTLREFMKLIL